MFFELATRRAAPRYLISSPRVVVLSLHQQDSNHPWYFAPTFWKDGLRASEKYFLGLLQRLPDGGVWMWIDEMLPFVKKDGCLVAPQASLDKILVPEKFKATYFKASDAESPTKKKNKKKKKKKKSSAPSADDLHEVVPNQKHAV
jgi:hypothetical protein